MWGLITHQKWLKGHLKVKTSELQQMQKGILLELSLSDWSRGYESQLPQIAPPEMSPVREMTDPVHQDILKKL